MKFNKKEFAREAVKLAGLDVEVRGADRGGRSGAMRRPKFAALANIKAKKYGVVSSSWQEGLATYLKSINEFKI